MRADDTGGAAPQPSAVRTAAAYQQVEVTLENLRTLCTDLMTDLVERTEQAHRKLAHADVGHGPFGRTPNGQSLAGMHSAALDVYTATLQKVRDELADMQAKLHATIASYEGTDADAGEVLTRYLASVESGPVTVSPAQIDDAAAQAAAQHQDVLDDYAQPSEAEQTGAEQTGAQQTGGAEADAPAGPPSEPAPSPQNRPTVWGQDSP
jgi:hypothetical protein